jgi:proline dehydrogenase
MPNTDLDLDDPEVAFKNVSDEKLASTQRLFRCIAGKLMTSRAFARFAFWFGSGALKADKYIPGHPARTFVERTIFAQFCGGKTLAECSETVEKLTGQGVGSILDYAAEGQKNEQGFQDAVRQVTETIERRSSPSERLPFAVFKVSAIARMELLEKVSLRDATLSADEGEEWRRVVGRVGMLCSSAIEAEKKIFIDAEHTWIQDAIDLLAESMMREHNRREAVVYTTVQMYRTDRMEYLERLTSSAKEEGYVVGVKLVRGAYMEIERDRAAKLNYPSPIHETKQATHDAYDDAIRFCLGHLSDVALVVASHNEPSVMLAANEMVRLGVDRDHRNVMFAQLYGMGDNITNALAGAGYPVAKYIPFGPVEETIPYLIRRAKENSSVDGHMARQRELVEFEVTRRKKVKGEMGLKR